MVKDRQVWNFSKVKWCKIYHRICATLPKPMSFFKTRTPMTKTCNGTKKMEHEMQAINSFTQINNSILWDKIFSFTTLLGAPLGDLRILSCFMKHVDKKLSTDVKIWCWMLHARIFIKDSKMQRIITPFIKTTTEHIKCEKVPFQLDMNVSIKLPLEMRWLRIRQKRSILCQKCGARNCL